MTRKALSNPGIFPLIVAADVLNSDYQLAVCPEVDACGAAADQYVGALDVRADDVCYWVCKEL
jgi:hypothetical protein